jgi:hypothetical protein
MQSVTRQLTPPLPQLLSGNSGQQCRCSGPNELQTNQGNWVTAGFATSAALATVDANVDAIVVDTGTTLPATLTTIEGKVDTVDTVVDGIQTDLSNGTDGLGAIKTAVDAIPAPERG